MSDRLVRLKPNPLPKINPVPEALVTGERRAFYSETKALFRVPWMGVVTMSFSHYPNFYKALLAGLQDVAQTQEFSTAQEELCAITDAAGACLGPKSLIADLKGMGYSEAELEDIRAVAEIFRTGNMPYILIATIARLLLEGGAITGKPPKSGSTQRQGETDLAPLTLMEIHHADQPLLDVYNDIKATLGLPLVNTDYRGLGRWPSYFGKAWSSLQPHIGSEKYEPLVTDVHDAAERLVRALPASAALDGTTLRAAAEMDAPLEEVLAVVCLFQWLLPGLAVNVAYFRQQL